MQYWGEMIDVTVASMVDGSFWGVVLRLLVGHMFGKARMCKMAWFANQRGRQALFSAITFEVTEHLTKSRDRVTEADIHITSQLTDRMNLRDDSQTTAQHAFRVGKSNDYLLCEKMRQFRSVCFDRFDLIRMFLEVQIQAAFADGSLHSNKREVLYVIAEELGISRTQFDQFLHMMQGGTQFGDGYQQQSGGGGWQQAQRGPTLEDACNVLGAKTTGDTTTIKRAYRKLMSEHHPDKLVAKGLPSEMMGMAKRKAQEIQKAYGLIEDQKGFK